MAQIIPLTAEEASMTGFTHVTKIKAADIAALTSGTAYSVFPTYATAATKTKLLVKEVAVYVKTAFTFSGGDTGTLVITVGDGTTANAYAASTTIKTAAWIPGANTTNKVPAGDIINFTPTAATQAITLVNAGEVHIYMQLVDGAALAKN